MCTVKANSLSVRQYNIYEEVSLLQPCYETQKHLSLICHGASGTAVTLVFIRLEHDLKMVVVD